jgi:hypothetical protein
MLDVLIAVLFMAFGAVAFIVVMALFGWALLWMQNGGRDD